MNVELRIQLGLFGKSVKLNPIKLDIVTINSTSSWAGSYHILSMGQHYDDYIITDMLGTLPQLAGLPTSHPYRRLTGKIRAGGVTGNIGEVVAAIFARQHLKIGIDGIAHIKPHRPFKKSKSPDYALKIGDIFPSVFSKIVPSGVGVTTPAWWPAESKARNSMTAAANGREEALRQLFGYWSLLAVSQPSTVGFGMIVVFRYKPTREVRVNLILPLHQTDLVEEIKKGIGTERERDLRRFLHDC